MIDHPMITIQDLEKSYGPTPVLRALTLDIKPQEKVSVIGPSGSGKSTLLRILMTLEAPDRGQVYVEGDPVWTSQGKKGDPRAAGTHLRKIRAKIGMVFQHFNLFPHWTVLRNLTEAPVTVLKQDPGVVRQRALELLDKVGLKDRAEAKPGQLSGGQKQRVAIARALALQPKIMLFDEITSALDPELVGEVLKVLRDLAQESPMTMLIVTHHMKFSRDISDRVLFFDEGKILEQGPPEQIFSEPREPRTRKFLKTLLEESF